MGKTQIRVQSNQFFGFLSANIIKIVALVCMTVDHVGVMFFSEQIIFRIIGRIAFPIFAFFVAEGCRHTRNKLRYFLVIFCLGILCEVFARIFAGITECNILLTLAVAILLVYAFDWLKTSAKNGDKKQCLASASVFVFAIGAVFVMSSIVPQYLPWFGGFDYGFFGILVPLFVSVFDKHILKLLMLAISLVLMTALRVPTWNIQWYCLLSLILIAMYDGTRGKYNIKYLFYAYYPLHLAALYAMLWIISRK